MMKSTRDVSSFIYRLIFIYNQIQCSRLKPVSSPIKALFSSHFGTLCSVCADSFSDNMKIICQILIFASVLHLCFSNVVRTSFDETTDVSLRTDNDARKDNLLDEISVVRVRLLKGKS